MKKIIGTVLAIIVLSSFRFVELSPVDVADITIKVGGMETEELFYGFAQGDQIVFSFEEVNGKELKEIEIIEYPNNSKFMDYKSSRIESKKINVTQKSIFQFRFSNSALTGRVCKVRIQRIPKTEDLVNFNTNWKYKTLYDTLYVPYTIDSLTGYDKIQVPYTKKELVKTDTVFLDKSIVQRAHTALNPDGDRSYVSFVLPANMRTDLQTKEVTSWAYYIGTDKKEPIVSNYLNTAAKTISSIDPVSGLALGALSLATSSAGNNINFWLVRDYQDVQLFMAREAFSMVEKGDASMASNRFVDGTKQGTVYICLDNDHTYPVDVLVKFSAVSITKTYEYKQYTKVEEKPVYVKLNKTRMEIKSTKIIVNED